MAMALHRFGTVFPILLEPLSRVSVPITISHLQWPDLSDWKEIKSGRVRAVDWKRWYEDKLIEIISRVEGDRARFAHEVDLIRSLLQPASFEAKFAEHVGRFVGREWVFKEYRSWLSQRPRSRIFWIEAGPGFGKTAVAANLSYLNRTAIVATWFCDASSADLSNAAQALRSIAFQMALRWDDFRLRLLAQAGLTETSGERDVADARGELDRLSTTDLFRRLLAEPISGLIWREQKLVILIDALDEATNKSGANELVDLLSQHLSGLPPWIAFAVTSRPEAEVVARLQGFQPFRIESDDPRNQADIRAYCDRHLVAIPEIAALPRRDQRHLFDRLVRNSAGLILYIRMLEDGLAERSLRLEELVTLEAGLPGLYRRYFASFAHRFGDRYATEARPLLRLVVAARGPLPADLARPALGVDSEALLEQRNRIGSYLVDTREGVQLFHNTLREWLASPASGPFHVDGAVGSYHLAELLWHDFQSATPTWDSHVLDWLPQLIQHSPHWQAPDDLRRLGIHLAAHNRFASARAVLEQFVVAGIASGLDITTPPAISALAAFVTVGHRLADHGSVQDAVRAAEVISRAAAAPAQLAARLIRAYCQRRAGDLADATETYRAASDEQVGAVFPDLQLRVKFQRAHVIHLSGNYADAAHAYEEIAAADAESPDEIEARETARRQLGDLLMLGGRFRDALRRFRESAQYRSRDPLWDLECQRFLGHVHRFNWMLGEAVALYAPAAAECERRGLGGMLGKTLVNMAETLCWTEPARAKAVAERAIEINEQTSNLIEMGKGLTALAIARLRLGESRKALEAAVRAEELQRKVGYKSGVVFAVGAKALVLKRLGRTRAVREALDLMDGTTRETGVYRFLHAAYSAACLDADIPEASGFDWLEGADLAMGLRLMRGG
jgi:tetratricopeptide (TPR) repeat protein